MCAGLPAVYTNYSAHGELLRKANAGIGVGGVLQPEHQNRVWRMIADLAQVIEAVRRLYFNRQLAAELGANGRAFVQNYRPEIVVEKWHQVFQQLISTPHDPNHLPLSNNPAVHVGRDSVLECGSPLPLLNRAPDTKAPEDWRSPKPVGTSSPIE
jgi:hypothetical protein